MKYYVVTPAKNEEKFISFTLESMLKQTIKPVQWIIVDDGSTDGTRKVIEKYTSGLDWVKVVTIDNKQEQKLYGSKVVRAFNAGYKLIDDKEYDFIVKLDADLTFPDNYFEEIGKAFSNNSKLGICGGYIVEKETDFVMKSSRFPRVQGAVKSVRTKCFSDIGGFMEANGWDGIDLLGALYLGWEVGNIPHKVIHHRIEASEYTSLKFFYNNGFTHYLQGNDWLLTLVRVVVMLKTKPYFLASFSYLRGFVSGFFSKEPKLVDEKFAKFIRSYHYKRLLNFRR